MTTLIIGLRGHHQTLVLGHFERFRNAMQLSQVKKKMIIRNTRP